MSIQRIIPEFMRPIEKVVADAEEPNQPQKTTARVENVKEGMCPICQVRLLRSTANGHEVEYCPEHSLVMPIRDQEDLIPSGGFLSGPDTSLC